MDASTTDIFRTAFSGLALLSLGATALSLHKEYGWRRKQMAVNMMAEWNKHTAGHREAIHQAYPKLLLHDPDAWSAFKRDAERIYDDNFGQDDKPLGAGDQGGQPDAGAKQAKLPKLPVDPDKREAAVASLRRSIVELLNYCEYVAVAYSEEVADQTIARATMMVTICEWYVALHPFVVARSREEPLGRGRDPWQKLAIVMEAETERLEDEESHVDLVKRLRAIFPTPVKPAKAVPPVPPVPPPPSSPPRPQ